MLSFEDVSRMKILLKIHVMTFHVTANSLIFSRNLLGPTHSVSRDDSLRFCFTLVGLFNRANFICSIRPVACTLSLGTEFCASHDIFDIFLFFDLLPVIFSVLVHHTAWGSTTVIVSRHDEFMELLPIFGVFDPAEFCFWIVGPITGSLSAEAEESAGLDIFHLCSFCPPGSPDVDVVACVRCLVLGHTTLREDL